MGYSESEIEEIYAFDYESALQDRAALSDDILESLGYTDDQIGILRAYSEGELAYEVAATATSSTCTGTLTRVSCGTNFIKIRYKWVWNICPTWVLHDRAAVGYLGVDSTGSFKAIEADEETSSCSLKYKYVFNDGSVSQVTEEPESFDVLSYGATCTYDEGTVLGNSTFYKWMAEGTMTIKITPVGDYTFSYVYALGKVAHKVVSGSLTPSVTFGTSSSVSVTFSSSININTVALKDGYLYNTSV